MNEVGVYVPIVGTITTIKPGSAIAGKIVTPLEGRTDTGELNSAIVKPKLNLYYEGNIYGHFKDWEEMLFHAADRLIANYPVVSRCWVDPTGFLQVGWWDHEQRSFDEIEGRQQYLDAWIGGGVSAMSQTAEDLAKLWRETAR